jgi:hypothetical protein
VVLGIFSLSATAKETDMIDQDKLSQYRKKTSISGTYLNVWNIVYRYINTNSKNFKLEDYIISFDEDDSSFIVNFNKPFTEPVVGGGVGTCRVNKQTHAVECKLTR